MKAYLYKNGWKIDLVGIRQLIFSSELKECYTLHVS